MSTGVGSSISIPFCLDIKSNPAFIDDGILLGGETASDGIECMFFDGVNKIVFDLNPGSGGSDPSVYQLGDRVYLIAFDGVTEQLYEFDKTTHLITKITNGNSPVFIVNAVWGDHLYFSTRESNTITTEIEFRLIKADLSGSVPSFSAIRTVSTPLNPAKFVYWNFPQIKWGKLYLTEDVCGLISSATSNLRVISIDQSDQVLEVHQDLQVDNVIGQLFEWDDTFWTYGGSSDQLYKSTDGISFSLELILVQIQLTIIIFPKIISLTSY